MIYYGGGGALSAINLLNNSVTLELLLASWYK